MTINHIIARTAVLLRAENKPVTSTWLMWTILNEHTDEELYETGTDIVDLAEKIEYYLAKVNIITVGQETS